MLIKELYQKKEEFADRIVELEGWVKSTRFSKNVGFIVLNDGSFFTPVQLVIDSNKDFFEEAAHLSNSSSIAIKGKLVLTPKAKQAFEIQVSEFQVINLSAEDYPLQNKRQTFEFLRQFPYLRSRTNTFQAVFRVRSEIAYAIHQYFHDLGFVYVHTPIITASDAEGAGEMFQVTTLDLEEPHQNEEKKVDYSKDFFGKAAHLTVSGQLELESYAMSHRKVYTFGPTFRAEKSNTPRHAAEFWMIEPEIAFSDLEDVMELAEGMVKHIISHVLKTLPEEMKFLNQFIDKSLLERLELVANHEFARMTYMEAIDILQKSGEKFEFPVDWGCDLQSEHEKYLTEKVVQGPLFVTDYPKDIKAFYMRLNEDGKTVAACDMLVPGIGELIGGSQREERIDYLTKMMEEKGMKLSDYQWYIDLNRFGGCKHGGYGLGFERMVMYMTGMKSIKDVIPFPRTVNSMI